MSIATVSRVLNASDRVSEKTKQRVLSVMEECGYVPNAFARGLGLNTMKTVGILCASAADPFLAQGVALIEKALRSSGYDSLLCCTEYDLNTRQSGASLLLSRHVDSLIFVGSQYVSEEDEKNEYIRQAAKSVPVMLVNAALAGENIYSVLCDDYHAAMEATESLLRKGRESVLFLYTGHTYSAVRKLRGYRAALEKRYLPVKNELILDFTGRDGGLMSVREALCALQDKGARFDGILCSEDSLAVGALKYAKAVKRSVPKSLSIIGCNNSQICECVEPELSSIDNRLPAMCGQCVETLLRVLGGREAPQKTIFTAELVTRGTT